MKSSVKLFLLMITATNIVSAMDNKNKVGNTFWHNLACKSEHLNWSQVQQEIRQFTNGKKKFLPNPLSINQEGKTARQIVEGIYQRSPSSGARNFATYLHNLEKDYKMHGALKYNCK